jgi:hypothetical protein
LFFNNKLLNYKNLCDNSLKEYKKFFFKDTLFDLNNKFSIHFLSKHPFQFYSRLNFAYDCFILAMHFILY